MTGHSKSPPPLYPPPPLLGNSTLNIILLLCLPSACREPSRYASTINTFPPGGVAFTGSSFDSVYWCGYLCQGQSVSFTSDTCFGFSFNKRTKQCHLYRSFDYDVGSIGSSPDVDHYRRQYSCREYRCLYYRPI